jgi:hypothetical protein
MVACVALLVLIALHAAGDVVDFEGLTTGVSVNGQAGWTVEDQWGNTSWGDDPAEYDQEVAVDSYDAANTVWRVSNAVTSGGLSGQPMSQVTDQAAGETGAALWNDRGSDHTEPLTPPDPGAYAGTNVFEGSFDFRSATGSPQTGLYITVSPTAKQFDGRQSYVELADDGTNGIDVFFYETGHTNDVWGASSQWVEIASDLSYTDWHSVEMTIEFIDGLQDVGGNLYGNDIVKVWVNGSLAHTGSSWETYYYGTPPYGLDPEDKHAVNCLTFPLRGTAVPGTDGGGFYIDNVEVDAPEAGLIPEPAGLGLLGLGVLGVVRRRKRS